MKIGSAEHRDIFCRHFMQTYTEFDPETLPWPELDQDALQRFEIRGGKMASLLNLWTDIEQMDNFFR